MESRDAAKVACPVWSEGWGKPQGAILKRRPRPYSTHISLGHERTAEHRKGHRLVVALGDTNVGLGPVCELFANNLGPFATNVGPQDCLFARNVDPNGPLFAGPSESFCRPLQVGICVGGTIACFFLQVFFPSEPVGINRPGNPTGDNEKHSDSEYCGGSIG